MKKVFLYCLISICILIAVAYILSRNLVAKSHVIRPVPKAENPDQFVKAHGQQLYIGDKPFRSVGVNRYNLLSYTSSHGLVGCANPFGEDDIDTMFAQLHDLGVTTVRFWLFQSFTNSGEDLSRFDYVINEANQYHMRLIPVFENNWHDCTAQHDKTPAWYETGYQKPYDAYPLSLKEYVGKIVERYKNTNEIMMWEVMNEAQDTNSQKLFDFAQDMSSFIKSQDRNHLVSIGITGTKDPNEVYQSIESLPEVDVLDYHDYSEEDEAMPVMLRMRMLDAQLLKKPLIVGESGITDSVTNRAELFQNKMQAFFNTGGAAYLIWSYGEPYVTNDTFNFASSDQVAKAVQETVKYINR